FAAGGAGGAACFARVVFAGVFVFVLVVLRAGVASMRSGAAGAAGFAWLAAAVIARATSLASSAMRAATG
ncbi:hypothetical protein, partial [Escherichia coli]|uniref:hypothetical protein n=1 Tax=Escherichia coli TaxID=562 RepID=UPI0019D5F48A